MVFLPLNRKWFLWACRRKECFLDMWETLREKYACILHSSRGWYLVLRHKKSVENLPVVHSTAHGSSIAQSGRMNNVRAHADMKHNLLQWHTKNAYLDKAYIQVPYKRRENSHPRASTVAFFDQILNLLDSCSQSKRQVNAFNMSGLLFPPKTRFVLRYLIRCCCTRLGVGDLFLDAARKRVSPCMLVKAK